MQPLIRILCPVDFSPVSTKALRQALDLARSSGGKVELMHVCNVPNYLRPDLLVWVDNFARPLAEVAQEGAQRGLDGLLAALPEADHSRVLGSIHFGSPAPTISQLAEEREANLIVMGTHGRRGIAHMMLGSVAERVVRSAPCPVMVVRADEHEL